MKNVVLSLVGLLMFVGCENMIFEPQESCGPVLGSSFGPEIGSDDVIVLDVEFTIYNYTINSSYLSVNGTLLNTGLSHIGSFYIEADFYSDSTFTNKIGSVQNHIDVNELRHGCTYDWELRLYGCGMNIYNNFTVKNLRAVDTTY